jgi:hypothetical protein
MISTIMTKEDLLKKMLILSFLLIMFSCTHKSDPQPSQATLLVGTWKLTALTGNNQDAYSTLQDCEKDNLTIFGKDGTYTENEGATKCNQTDPQVIQTGTWSLIENASKLKISYPDGTSDIFMLTAITSTSLKLTSTQTFNGQNITLVATYTKQ